MKHLVTIIIVSTFLATAIAKSPIVEIEIEVLGVCNDCKERIEDAAYIKGVKFAEWNKHTKKLKVAFREDKIALDSIQKSIANIGHDTEKFKASEKAYNNLPGCCRYRDGVETH